MKELPSGYKLYITHFRRFAEVPFFMTKWDGKSEGLSLLPTGGATEVFIMDEKETPVAWGIASCSNRDAFNKKIGRNIALGRALKKMEV